MDDLETADDLKHDLRVLRDVSEEWGYLATVEAMRQTVARYGYADQPSISIIANGIACGREAITYEETVDLESYDEVFSIQGVDEL